MSDAPSPVFADRRQEFLDHAFQGYAGWAGASLVDLGPGSARVAFTPRAEMLTPWGSLHGGVINSLVELPAFLSLLAALTAAELPVTNDIFIQHVAALPGDVRYVLEGRLIKRSRSMAWTEIAVHAADRLVSLARITKTVLPRPAQPAPWHKATAFFPNP